MVGVGIIMILATMAGPDLVEMFRNQQLADDLTMVQADIQTARTIAMGQNTFVTVLFTGPPTPAYTVFLDNAGGNSGNGVQDIGEVLVDNTIISQPRVFKLNANEVTLVGNATPDTPFSIIFDGGGMQIGLPGNPSFTLTRTRGSGKTYTVTTTSGGDVYVSS